MSSLPLRALAITTILLAGLLVSPRAEAHPDAEIPVLVEISLTDVVVDGFGKDDFTVGRMRLRLVMGLTYPGHDVEDPAKSLEFVIELVDKEGQGEGKWMSTPWRTERLDQGQYANDQVVREPGRTTQGRDIDGRGALYIQGGHNVQRDLDPDLVHLWTHAECRERAEPIEVQVEMLQVSEVQPILADIAGKLLSSFASWTPAGIFAKIVISKATDFAEKKLREGGTHLGQNTIVLEDGDSQVVITGANRESVQLTFTLTQSFPGDETSCVDDDPFFAFLTEPPEESGIGILPGHALACASLQSDQTEAQHLRPALGNPEAWTQGDLEVEQAQEAALAAAKAGLLAFAALNQGTNPEALAAFERAAAVALEDPQRATQAFSAALKAHFVGGSGALQPEPLTMVLTPLIRPAGEAAYLFLTGAQSGQVVLRLLTVPAPGQEGTAMLGSSRCTASGVCTEEAPISIAGIMWNEGPVDFVPVLDTSAQTLVGYTGALGHVNVREVEGPKLEAFPAAVTWAKRMELAIPAEPVSGLAKQMFGGQNAVKVRLRDGNEISTDVLVGDGRVGPVTWTGGELDKRWYPALPWPVAAPAVARRTITTDEATIDRILASSDKAEALSQAIARKDVRIDKGGSIIGVAAWAARIDTRLASTPYDVGLGQTKQVHLDGTPVHLERHTRGYVIARPLEQQGWNTAPLGSGLRSLPPAHVVLVLDPYAPASAPDVVKGWTTMPMQALLNTPPPRSAWTPSASAGLLSFGGGASAFQAAGGLG